MRTNNILAKMRSGEKACGVSFSFASPDLIELAGIAGFDYVFLDGEHGPFTVETIESLCRAADAAGLTPIARVPDTSLPTILRYLDRGVMGVMGPHVCTGADAQRLADGCRFTPRGKRSFGSGRGTYFGVPAPRGESMRQIDDEMLVIALLEDVEALENLSDLLAVEGIDFFSFGPNDLAQSMGLTGQPDHPEVKAAMSRATDRIHKAGKKLMSDAMVSTMAADLFLEAARGFLRQSGKP
jgi:4-hydroxy-2-oxoheptanedioate aldolase